MKIGIVQQHNVADMKANCQRLAERIERLAKDGAELITELYREVHSAFCVEGAFEFAAHVLSSPFGVL